MRTIALLLCLFLPDAWAAEKPTIIFIAGEYEYHSKETLPAYAKELEKDFAVETIVLQRPGDQKIESIPGLEALERADLAVLFIRRMTLPDDQLNQIKRYVKTGKPLIGLRTASHSFQNWKEFDAEVLGGNYQNHHGNKLKTSVSINPEAQEHPILRRVTPFVSDGSLYKNTPLRPGTEVLLIGKVDGHAPEPIAWTHSRKGARVFYTSLGHPNDFKEESFRNLLQNGIEWALEKPLEKKQP